MRKGWSHGTEAGRSAPSTGATSPSLRSPPRAGNITGRSKRRSPNPRAKRSRRVRTENDLRRHLTVAVSKWRVPGRKQEGCARAGGGLGRGLGWAGMSRMGSEGGACVAGGLQPVSPKRCPLPISKLLVHELTGDPGVWELFLHARRSLCNRSQSPGRGGGWGGGHGGGRGGGHGGGW